VSHPNLILIYNLTHVYRHYKVREIEKKIHTQMLSFGIYWREKIEKIL